MAQSENTLEKNLLQAGYAIQYTISASHVECSICHPDWATPNPYAARVLPSGAGWTMEKALREAVRSDDALREQWLTEDIVYGTI